jgi:hypothetical protein
MIDCNSISDKIDTIIIYLELEDDTVNIKSVYSIALKDNYEPYVNCRRKIIFESFQSRLLMYCP